MFSYCKCLFVFLLVCFCTISRAQTAPYTLIPPQYELEHLKLNSKDDIGLLNDINEDAEGYLWLAGSGGLHVFDGNLTVTYKNGDGQYNFSGTSNNRQLYSLTKTNDDNFWIVEDTTRCILFDATKRKISAGISVKSGKTAALYYAAIANDSSLYLSYVDRITGKATIDKVINNDSSVQLYETKGSVNNPTYYHYKIIENNHWLIYSDSLVRISLDGKNVEVYKLPHVFLSGYWLYTDKHNLYFIPNRGDAIFYLNSTTNKIENFIQLPDIVKNKVFALFIKDNMVYVGNNLNLFIIDRKNNTIQDLSPQFTALAEKEVPNSFAIDFLNFFQRRDSSLLVCTQKDIFRLKKKIQPEAYYKQHVEVSYNSKGVLSFRGITEDEHKNVYASYYTGISVKKPTSTYFKPIDTKKYLNSDLISTFSLNYWNGNLLWNNVVINVATGKPVYLGKNNFSGHCTQYLHNDTLWFIIWYTNELHCYDLKRSKLSTYQLDKKMSNNKGFLSAICDITGDASGQNLWISSNWEGISLISKSGALLKQYNAAALQTKNPDINELELSGNHLWYGCINGLGDLNTETGKAVLYKNPVLTNSLSLQDRTVFSILKDSANNFYLGSNYGLLYFDTHINKFYNLPNDHPLAKIEFNRSSNFQSSDHRYYFGTTNGLYSFMPGELEFANPTETLKPIKLFSVAVFNVQENRNRFLSKDLDSIGKLILDAFDNNLELNFSVPEYYHTVYYSYRIKDQSNSWTEYKADNKILLYALPPGNYVLEVKASTSISDESAAYYSLPIEKLQVWYKKGWVITLFILAALALIMVFIRYRFNQKLKRQKELAALRTNISSDLHDDVGTLLSGLAMQSQMLAYTATGVDKEQLNEISNMSREAMEHMRDTVWAMDSRKDKYENLIDRMRAFAEKNLALKKVTHEFIIENIDTKKFIDPEKRQTIYLIFKEAITNIIKHSDGTHVTIKFMQEKNKIILSVHDNGNKKTVTHSDGLGVSNMKMRAEKVGGNLATQHEDGYTIELVINN